MDKKEGHKIVIDSVKEFDQFVGIGEKTKNVGVVYIGGGVPKDLTQLIAISVSPKTKDQGVPGRKGHIRKGLKEYSYPHITHALCERGKTKRKAPDMSWIFSDVS